jgi:hypothetical protein
VSRSHRPYFALMGLCLALYALAGFVVRYYSTTLAVFMAAVATAIPPIAAIVANAGREGQDPPQDGSP